MPKLKKLKATLGVIFQHCVTLPAPTRLQSGTARWRKLLWCPKNPSNWLVKNSPFYDVFFSRPHHNTTYACEVESWCPIEIDKLPLGDERALMQKSEDYTVFIKNSVAFPYFGHQFARNNLIGKNGRPCMYKATMDGNNGCQIFRLGDIITLAGGNFSK